MNPTNLDDFPDLLPLMVSADDLNLVVFANWDSLDVVFLLELLAERGAHYLPPLVAGRIKVSLALLAARARNKTISLHF